MEPDLHAEFKRRKEGGSRKTNEDNYSSSNRSRNNISRRMPDEPDLYTDDSGIVNLERQDQLEKIQQYEEIEQMNQPVLLDTAPVSNRSVVTRLTTWIPNNKMMIGVLVIAIVVGIYSFVLRQKVVKNKMQFENYNTNNLKGHNTVNTLNNLNTNPVTNKYLPSQHSFTPPDMFTTAEEAEMRQNHVLSTNNNSIHNSHTAEAYNIPNSYIPAVPVVPVSLPPLPHVAPLAPVMPYVNSYPNPSPSSLEDNSSPILVSANKNTSTNANDNVNENYNDNVNISKSFETRDGINTRGSISKGNLSSVSTAASSEDVLQRSSSIYKPKPH